MPRSNAARHITPERIGYYPVQFADAQQALAMLADIDFRYAALVEKLERRPE